MREELKIQKQINYQNLKSEEDFYKAIGLTFISPEIREDTGEIELASKNNLPKLIEKKDIKGEFHIHSTSLSSHLMTLEKIYRRNDFKS